MIFAALAMLVLAAIALPMAIVALARTAPKPEQPAEQGAGVTVPLGTSDVPNGTVETN
ncbi:hypothetical protein GCM10010174_89350 [Kutzneria viridogrisea]|uniref:Secreted protein n=2 Tax=Kutzneria TaxID=43356 RepID=W5WNE5_9PSEU|nr:hypothetical protein [Kutzneria albida]AHI02072.1 hypothetical protein KALB_8715 [Kutzneria albida DSM 43870]MBA8929367.1 hypothetical protein [Kutzneria viridogrisea]